MEWEAFLTYFSLLLLQVSLGSCFSKLQEPPGRSKNGFLFQDLAQVYLEEDTMFYRQFIDAQPIVDKMNRLGLLTNSSLEVCLTSSKQEVNPLNQHNVLNKVQIRNSSDFLVILSEKLTLSSANSACRTLGGHLVEPTTSPIREAVSTLLLRNQAEYTFVGTTFDVNTGQFLMQQDRTPVQYIFPAKTWCTLEDNKKACTESEFTNVEAIDDFYKTLLISNDAKIVAYNPFHIDDEFFGELSKYNWKYNSFYYEYLNSWGSGQPANIKAPLAIFRDMYRHKPILLQPVCHIPSATINQPEVSAKSCLSKHNYLKSMYQSVINKYRHSELQSYAQISSSGEFTQSHLQINKRAPILPPWSPLLNHLVPSSLVSKIEKLENYVHERSHNLGEFKIFTNLRFDNLLQRAQSLNDSLSSVQISLQKVQSYLADSAYFSAFNKECTDLKLEIENFDRILISLKQGKYPKEFDTFHDIKTLAKNNLPPTLSPSQNRDMYRVAMQHQPTNNTFKIILAVPCSSSPYTVTKITPIPVITESAVPNVHHPIIARNKNNLGYFPLTAQDLVMPNGGVLQMQDVVMHSISSQTCGWSLLSHSSTNCTFSHYPHKYFLQPVPNGVLFSFDTELTTFSCPHMITPTIQNISGAGLLKGPKDCSLTIGNSGLQVQFSAANVSSSLSITKFPLLPVPLSFHQTISSIDTLTWTSNTLSMEIDKIQQQLAIHNENMDSVSSTVNTTSSTLTIVSCVLCGLILLIILTVLFYHFCVLKKPLEHLRKSIAEKFTYIHTDSPNLVGINDPQNPDLL